MSVLKKSGGDKVIVASAAYAKQGASESRMLELFRNLLQLSASHELRRKDRRQQTDDWEKRARFRNRIDPGGCSPFLKAAVTLTCEIEIDEFVPQVEKAHWNVNNCIVLATAGRGSDNCVRGATCIHIVNQTAQRNCAIGI